MKTFLYILISILSFNLYSQEGIPLELKVKTQTGLPYSYLSNYGLDSTRIHNKVNEIITNGIQKKAFPGAQLLVVKKGSIVFHKAYGFHTYDSIQPLGLSDLYDLASVTKILGPLPALMLLVDQGKIDLDTPFSTYWKAWQKRKDKRDLTLREILAHQAGLKSYTIFLKKVLKQDYTIKHRFIRHHKSAKFNNQVYTKLFIKNNFYKKIYKSITRSTVNKEKKYVYSGLSFLLFPKLIEQITGVSYEAYLKQNIYQPLGATTLGFTPKLYNYTNKIIPTELDTLFRKDVVSGWVHDENAALLGGVSGNAGLFGTAKDVALIMQMYQNYGTLNGKRYISEETLKEFTKVQYSENNNRRGLGFDKPLLNNKHLSMEKAYPASQTASSSFGHAGFTGTFVWADPKNQLVFIFLSNRVYPSRSHRKLYCLSIRQELQSLFYKQQNINKN